MSNTRDFQEETSEVLILLKTILFIIAVLMELLLKIIKKIKFKMNFVSIALGPPI